MFKLRENKTLDVNWKMKWVKKKGSITYVNEAVTEMEMKQGCSRAGVGVDGILDGGFDSGESVGACFGVKMFRELMSWWVEGKDEKVEDDQKIWEAAECGGVSG